MNISKINYFNHLINETYDFENELVQLSLKIYPSPFLKELITKELIPICTKIRGLFIIAKEGLENESKKDLSPIILAAEDFWRSKSLKDLTYSLSNTNLKSYPLEIMNVFRDMIDKIDSSPFQVITVPKDNMNFTFREIWLPLKHNIEASLGINLHTDKKLIELTFPVNHKDNVFLSGIYAHEIGHYFDRNIKIWAKVFTEELSNTPELYSLKKFVLRHRDNSPSDDLFINSFFEEWIIGHWLREAIADCIGVYLLGPAFVFSMMDLFISLKGREALTGSHLSDNPSLTHPPSGLRYKLQMELLIDLGLKDSCCDEIKQTLDSFSDTWDSATMQFPNNKLTIDSEYYLLETKEFYDEVIKIWNDCLPRVKGEVDKLLGVHRISTDDIVIAYRLANERIKNVVPPNELDLEPVNMNSIINSGWFARLLYKDDIITSIRSIEGHKSEYDFLNHLNSLLRYALNAARVQGRWSS